MGRRITNDDDRKNTLNFKVKRLATLARHNKGDTVYVARLLHERVSAVARTGENKRRSVPFLPLLASLFRPHGRRRKTRTRSGRGKTLRARFANGGSRRPSVRAQERSVESKRFSSRKIDRNRNDARHVTRLGQWGRCILIHHPVPPASL